MFRSVSHFGQVRIGRLLWVAILGVSLALAGCCSSLNLRGEGYPEDELSTWVGQFREAGDDDDAFVWSNKAKQINRNLGGSRPAP
jgi:hypothetical protein